MQIEAPQETLTPTAKSLSFGKPMDALEILLKGWPIILGGIMLIVALSKLENRVSVLEEKAKSLFEILNKKK